MNVLHVVGGLDSGGAEKMLLNLLKEHAQSNSERVWYFLCFGTEKSYQLTEEIKKYGGKIIFIPFFTPTNFVKNGVKLKKIVRQCNVEIVHIHTLLQSGYLSMILSLMTNTKIAVHAHSSHDNSSNNQSTLRRIYEILSIKLIKKFGNVFMSCSDSASNYLFPQIDKKKVIKFNNAINIDQYLSINETNRNERTNLTIVGRLEKVKNHEFVFLLCEELLRRQQNIVLNIVGTGSLKGQLEHKAIELGIEDNIKFWGYVERVEKIYEITDYLIMPSFFEGFPMTLLESQASGTYALVSDRVDRKVDLGLSLIDFLNIEEVNSWADIIESKRHLKKTSKNEIKEAFEKQHYTIESSYKQLETIYGVMMNV